jgi:hypothetical protein
MATGRVPATLSLQDFSLVTPVEFQLLASRDVALARSVCRVAGFQEMPRDELGKFRKIGRPRRREPGTDDLSRSCTFTIYGLSRQKDYNSTLKGEAGTRV